MTRISIAACFALSSVAWAGAEDFPMGSTTADVDARFPPFQCRTVSLGPRRSFCKYFEPPATHRQFDVPDLDVFWEFPVIAVTFDFGDAKLEEMDWTFEARGSPGGKVIDPMKLRAALESRFGKPSSTQPRSIGRNGGLNQLDTTWIVNGERWMLRTYPGAAINVDLHRLSKDAPDQP